ncbi:hypothetical protein GBA52_026786 [Prunus armeniaca]|nr:hypothetical protein GBA52_026786 [Prunus armeniaca]
MEIGNNKDTRILLYYTHKGISSSPLGLGLGGGGWKSPKAASSNKCWPGQCGVHLPGLARRQGLPEQQPEGRLTSA